jgi:hypothetical protein
MIAALVAAVEQPPASGTLRVEVPEIKAAFRLKAEAALSKP